MPFGNNPIRIMQDSAGRTEQLQMGNRGQQIREANGQGGYNYFQKIGDGFYENPKTNRILDLNDGKTIAGGFTGSLAHDAWNFVGNG